MFPTEFAFQNVTNWYPIFLRILVDGRWAGSGGATAALTDPSSGKSDRGHGPSRGSEHVCIKCCFGQDG